jgi:hypothetical protein
VNWEARETKKDVSPRLKCPQPLPGNDVQCHHHSKTKDSGADDRHDPMCLRLGRPSIPATVGERANVVL